jgi:hypothetical protein
MKTDEQIRAEWKQAQERDEPTSMKTRLIKQEITKRAKDYLISIGETEMTNQEVLDWLDGA